MYCYSPGPGCIKQLKITLHFLQPFPAFWKFSLHTIIENQQKLDKRVGQAQYGCENILWVTENSCTKSHLNLSCFMQPGPGSDTSSLYVTSAICIDMHLHS